MTINDGCRADKRKARTPEQAPWQPVIDALAEDWRLLKHHHPVGAYLPIGQLDGDCLCGSGAWPCATVRAAIVRGVEGGVA